MKLALHLVTAADGVATRGPPNATKASRPGRSPTLPPQACTKFNDRRGIPLTVNIDAFSVSYDSSDRLKGVVAVALL